MWAKQRWNHWMIVVDIEVCVSTLWFAYTGLSFLISAVDAAAVVGMRINELQKNVFHSRFVFAANTPPPPPAAAATTIVILISNW